MKLRPEWVFDAHGTVFEGAEAVEQQLQRKLDFLMTIRSRVHQFAIHEQTIEELTRKVFDRRSLVHFLSFGEGWLSLITGSDFSRSNIVKSFLREKFRTTASAEKAFIKKEIQDTFISSTDAQQL
ncbi:hypothetical protein [uncultured Gimesia sp.]|uniref:hypothetical protein n=1 Tax=uncultured Gimesia sp. TaxID=1678688 RepID=UPI0030DD55FD|tara:strand:- start:59761 stop:60135 length:375 start_codon:yes stop_codon:yes gene_type:complete